MRSCFNTPSGYAELEDLMMLSCSCAIKLRIAVLNMEEKA